MYSPWFTVTVALDNVVGTYIYGKPIVEERSGVACRKVVTLVGVVKKAPRESVTLAER